MADWNVFEIFKFLKSEEHSAVKCKAGQKHRHIFVQTYVETRKIVQENVTCSLGKYAKGLVVMNQIRKLWF